MIMLLLTQCPGPLWYFAVFSADPTQHTQWLAIKKLKLPVFKIDKKEVVLGIASLLCV